jgi:predicted Holliday junction resolvase-like endonuclease
MSIRMLALELYRVMKLIEELEKKLESQEVGSRERGELQKKLREARAEKDRLKKMMEGAKGD